MVECLTHFERNFDFDCTNFRDLQVPSSGTTIYIHSFLDYLWFFIKKILITIYRMFYFYPLLSTTEKIIYIYIYIYELQLAGCHIIDYYNPLSINSMSD